jgi:hypothetical protein
MTIDESWELDALCQTIVGRVYASLGSRLESQEIARLAAELACEITLAIYLEAVQPQGEVATEALDTFLQRQGIVDAGEEWRWVN